MRQIFVTPVLGAEPEGHAVEIGDLTQAPSSELLDLDELWSSGESILLLGRKESGKTTLLAHLAQRASDESDPLRAKMPFYVSLSACSRKKHGILAEVRAIADDCGLKPQIDDALRLGNCLILIDDVDLTDERRKDQVRIFAEGFPENRFAVAVEQDLAATIGLDEQLDLGISSSRVYLHSFRRKQLRILAENWYAAAPVRPAHLTESLAEGLKAANLPWTPFNVAALLWTFETFEQFRPESKAALVEKLVEILLRKLQPEKGKRGLVDFKNREHFLSMLAEKLVRRDEDFIEAHLLEKFAVDYFAEMGWQTSIAPFLNDFFEHGILIEDTDGVRFRFRCLLHYFIVKRMSHSQPFRDEITSEENYLEYSEEIDYFTGLSRREREIVDTLRSRLDVSLQSLTSQLDPSLFEQTPIEKSLLDFFPDSNSLQKILRENAPSESEREEMLDLVDQRASADNQRISRKKARTELSRIFASLSLFSRALRNSELVEDLDFKRRHLEASIHYWSSAILVAILLVEQEAAANLDLREEERAFGESFLKVVVALIGYEGARYTIATEKLAALILEGATNAEAPIHVQMIYVFLAIDLRLKDSARLAEGFVNRIEKIRFPLDVTLAKLFANYVLGDAHDRSSLERIIARIYTAENPTGTSAGDTAKRAKTATALRRLALLTDQT